MKKKFCALMAQGIIDIVETQLVSRNVNGDKIVLREAMYFDAMKC